MAVAERRRTLPRSLRVGGTILAGLVVIALAAPLLATGRPLLARGASGLEMPALRGGGSGLSATEADRRGVPIVRAPLPHDPNSNDLDAVLEPPSVAHVMGTDYLGRDLAARVVHGSRVSLAVGLWTALLSLAAGVPLGAIAGYRGGWTDSLVGRVVEAVLCVPSLLIALALLTAPPRWLADLPDPIRIAVTLALTGWTPAARYLRGEFLRLRSSDMVAAARATGAGPLRIAVRHVLPSAVTPVLVTAAFSVGAAILLEATLSFLGLGVSPPTATWGGLLGEARNHGESAWWLTLFPGSCLFLAVLSSNLVGEGLRDLLDPRSNR